METAFFKRANWFLREVKKGTFPNTSVMAKEFDISTKTASRVIDKMKAEFGAPLEYSASEKGFSITNDSFMLPCHCELSEHEVSVLEMIKTKLEKSGATREMAVIAGILDRMGGV